MEEPPPSSSQGDDAAANPSPLRGTQGTRPDPESAPQESKESGVVFILDTVAPVHATSCAELLSDPRPPEEGDGDGAASFPTRAGEDHAVTALGSITTPDFVIDRVRLVPALGPGRTLISVSQLAGQGLTVMLGRGHCEIKEESTGKLAGRGLLRDDGFYYLEFLRIPQS